MAIIRRSVSVNALTNLKRAHESKTDCRNLRRRISDDSRDLVFYFLDGVLTSINYGRWLPVCLTPLNRKLLSHIQIFLLLFQIQSAATTFSAHHLTVTLIHSPHKPQSPAQATEDLHPTSPAILSSVVRVLAHHIFQLPPLPTARPILR